jgi:maltooligosyltrehalose synthase
MKDSAFALSYYSEEEDAKFKVLSNDPETWNESYDSWRENAEKAIRNLKGGGANITRVPLIFSEVQQWCAMSGRENDSSARSEYDAPKLRRG